MIKVNFTNVAYNLFLAHFWLEVVLYRMSFSLLPLVVWVICSLVEALQWSHGFSSHFGLTIIYQWQTESLITCIYVRHYKRVSYG